MLDLFNTAMESAVRSLVILTEIRSPIDLDLLVLYEYFLVHSGDFPAGPPSMHPPVPHRSGELLVRRDVVRSGLDYGLRKTLIERCLGASGVEYKATDIAPEFLSYFSSNYFKAVRERAAWVSRELHSAPRSDLMTLVENNLDSWGADTAEFLLVPSE